MILGIDCSELNIEKENLLQTRKRMNFNQSSIVIHIIRFVLTEDLPSNRLKIIYSKRLITL